MKFFLSLAFLLTGCFQALPPDQYEEFQNHHKAAIEAVKGSEFIKYEGKEDQPHISVVHESEVKRECSYNRPTGCFTTSYDRCEGLEIILVASFLEEPNRSSIVVHEFIHAIWNAHGVPVGTHHTRHKEEFQEAWNRALKILEETTDYTPEVVFVKEM